MSSCPCVEIGWRLQRAHWGQGYVTEAAGAWLPAVLGFDALRLAEIVAFTDRDDHRSLAVMRRLGMSRDPSRDFDFPEFPEGDPRRAALMHRMTQAKAMRSSCSRRSAPIGQLPSIDLYAFSKVFGLSCVFAAAAMRNVWLPCEGIGPILQCSIRQSEGAAAMAPSRRKDM